MTIDSEEIRRLAKLASLELEADEISRFASELSSVLEHCVTVSNFGGAPSDSVRPENRPLRSDDVREPGRSMDMDGLKWVMVENERFFIVPRVDVGER